MYVGLALANVPIYWENSNQTGVEDECEMLKLHPKK
jgi:hypothetical protein